MTPGDVKSAFARRGIAIAEWARANGYPEKLVYRVLRSAQVPLRGKSHDIAVQLGLKSGVVRAAQPTARFAGGRESAAASRRRLKCAGKELTCKGVAYR